MQNVVGAEDGDAYEGCVICPVVLWSLSPSRSLWGGWAFSLMIRTEVWFLAPDSTFLLTQSLGGTGNVAHDWISAIHMDTWIGFLLPNFGSCLTVAGIYTVNQLVGIFLSLAFFVLWLFKLRKKILSNCESGQEWHDQTCGLGRVTVVVKAAVGVWRPGLSLGERLWSVWCRILNKDSGAAHKVDQRRWCPIWEPGIEMLKVYSFVSGHRRWSWSCLGILMMVPGRFCQQPSAVSPSVSM